MSHGSDFKSLIWGAVLLLLVRCSAGGQWLRMSIAPTIAMFTVLATSWSLFSGPTHYISLATAAFFGVGGYLVGTGTFDYNMGFWPMSPLRRLSARPFLRPATLRLSGVYFVIFTLGLAEMIRTLVSRSRTTLPGRAGFMS